MMAFAETFTILTRTVSGQDADGNDVYTVVETATKGAFTPAGTTELIQGQSTVLTHDMLYLTAGQPVPSANDQVRARGVVRDVDGTPSTYASPFTGWAPGAVVRLLEVSG
ncbi:MAG: hypothetical protein ACRDRL_28990 [Sciscionella sp.]